MSNYELFFDLAVVLAIGQLTSALHVEKIGLTQIFTLGLEFMADHHHHQLGVIFFITSVVIYYLGVLATSIYNFDIYKVNRQIVAKYLATLALGSLSLYLFKNNLTAMGIILIILGQAMLLLNMRYRRRKREENNVSHPDPTQNLRDFS